MWGSILPRRYLRLPSTSRASTGATTGALRMARWPARASIYNGIPNMTGSSISSPTPSLITTSYWPDRKPCHPASPIPGLSSPSFSSMPANCSTLSRSAACRSAVAPASPAPSGSGPRSTLLRATTGSSFQMKSGACSCFLADNRGLHFFVMSAQERLLIIESTCHLVKLGGGLPLASRYVIMDEHIQENPCLLSERATFFYGEGYPDRGSRTA